ncbi:MAG: hypothetical protein ACTS3F_08045 [Phycisphaerales bacterium]
MYWYTWVIMGGVVLAITAFGIVSSVLSGMQRGWRALISEFPMERGPEGDAFTGRSTMFVFAPGEMPKRYGCLAFFMPWTWKFPQSVRFASDAEALHIMQDGGRLAPSGGARIPFSELRLINVFEMKLAFTFWGGRFGEHATLRAGGCILTVPAHQFEREIELLREMGLTETVETAGEGFGDAVDEDGSWDDREAQRPGPGPGPGGDASGRDADRPAPSWDDFRNRR